MHRFFIDTHQINFIQNRIIIENEDVKHISRVLRLKEKDKVEICDGKNTEYICEIQSVDKNSVSLSIIGKEQSFKEPPIKTVLYQGSPKGDKMNLIIQKTVELGITEIIPVKMKRTIVQFGDKDKQKKVDRWQRVALEAAKQSKRGIVPTVHFPLNFDQALEHSKKNQLNIMPYENENKKGFRTVMESLNKDNIDKIGIWIGPEGGLAEEEVAKAINNRVHLITLGPRILRTETAGFITLSLIMYELGDL